MQILLNFRKTIIFLAASIFLISSLLMIFSPLANAQEKNKDNTGQLSDKELNEESQFIKNEALKFDENGQPVGIDLNKVKQRHGYIPQEAKEANAILEEKAIKKGEVVEEVGNGYKNSNDCFYSEILKNVKSSLPTTVISAVADYAKSGQYGKAAKRLIKSGVKGSEVGIVYTIVSVDTQCNYKYGLLQ